MKTEQEKQEENRILLKAEEMGVESLSPQEYEKLESALHWIREARHLGGGYKTLLDIVKQLESCKYECEGGLLENNIAFTKLKEIAEKVSVPLDALVMQKGTDIYNMQLHDIIDLSKVEGLGYLPFRYIMRVAGGWIYANYNTDLDTYTDKLFVPFNNDMQKVDIPY